MECTSTSLSIYMLPAEMIVYILKFLNRSDVLVCMRVSKCWMKHCLFICQQAIIEPVSLCVLSTNHRILYIYEKHGLGLIYPNVSRRFAFTLAGSYSSSSCTMCMHIPLLNTSGKNCVFCASYPLASSNTETGGCTLLCGFGRLFMHYNARGHVILTRVSNLPTDGSGDVTTIFKCEETESVHKFYHWFDVVVTISENITHCTIGHRSSVVASFDVSLPERIGLDYDNAAITVSGTKLVVIV